MPCRAILAAVTRYVIDAASLVRIAADGTPIADEHQLVAPGYIRTDSLALVLDSVRRGELSDEAALRLHQRMTTVKIRLLGDRVSRRTAWEIARRHDGVSIRDAEYVAIVKLQADALITLDDRLAALARGLVALAPFDALHGTVAAD